MGIVHTMQPWILPDCDEDLKKAIRKNGVLCHAIKNELIVPYEKYLKHLILIESGLASQNIFSYDLNKPVAMALAIPGRVLGYRMYFARRHSQAFLLALRKTRYYSISFADLDGIAEKDHAVYKMLVKCAIDSLESDLEGMITMFSRAPDERMALFFKSLIVSYGGSLEEEWIPVPVKLYHHEIARIIYVTPITTERVLTKWRKKGLYRKMDGQIFVSGKIFEDRNLFGIGGRKAYCRQNLPDDLI